MPARSPRASRRAAHRRCFPTTKTGLRESGDSIRGWLLGMNVGVVMMVGYRGWTRHGVTSDTAATYTEPFINAYGLHYYLVESDADAPRISIAFEEAAKTKR